jgi:Family of unknown function (DUF5985)
MNAFLYGMNTMGFLVAGLFFLRFWRKTSDALFAAFSAAFLLFAIDQLSHALQETPPSAQGWAFFFRLAGFGLLIFAVLGKNLK